MKKSLLLILASLFAVFALAGCAEDSKNNNGGTTPTTPGTVPAEYAGTYEVVFFGSQVTNVRDAGPFGSMADMFYISNDCAKAAELYPDVIGANGKNNCTTDGQSTLLDGKIVIAVDNGNMNITSRMQMEGGSVDMSPADKYQYTIYNLASSLSGQGVKSYNYDAANNAPSATAAEFPESPFTVEQLADGTVRIDMTLVGKVVEGIATVDAKNTIILKKLSNDTTALKNALQKSFTTNTPVDLTKPETLNGNYEVTFFGSQVTNVRDAGPFGSMADMFYISNDCAKAAELYPDIVDLTGSASTPVKNWCDPKGTQSTILDGKVVITVSNDNLNITSRMQMEGGAVDMSPTDKYQFTEYYITNDLTTFSGKGVSSWNYDDTNNTPSATATEYAESPYSISLLEDGSIRIDMTLVGKVVEGIATVDAKNTIILTKISDDTTALENALQKEFTPAEPAN